MEKQNFVDLVATYIEGRNHGKNGFLVHEMEVVAPDKSIVEFVIDAGTGTILTQSVDEPDDHEHGEHEDDDDADRVFHGRQPFKTVTFAKGCRHPGDVYYV